MLNVGSLLHRFLACSIHFSDEESMTDCIVFLSNVLNNDFTLNSPFLKSIRALLMALISWGFSLKYNISVKKKWVLRHRAMETVYASKILSMDNIGQKLIVTKWGLEKKINRNLLFVKRYNSIQFWLKFVAE